VRGGLGWSQGHQITANAFNELPLRHADDPVEVANAARSSVRHVPEIASSPPPQSCPLVAVRIGASPRLKLTMAKIGCVMKLATFNVNGVNGRLPRLLEWLAEAQPDVACLQEIKTGDASFPIDAIEAAGYGAIWHGQPRHHGVAILARGDIPVEIRRGLPGDESDAQARYLEARVKGVTVASVYLPNGNPQPGPRFDYKLAWFERLTRHAQTLRADGGAVVLAGDFNVVPTNADIYNAWLWRFDAVLQPESKAAYRRLLAQGWVDAARYLHPKDRTYTFWVNEAAFRRNAGFRMDFLLLNSELAPRLLRAEVDTEHRARHKPSDHAPVWIELKSV
jgi:exodeoxyribonuclease III